MKLITASETQGLQSVIRSSECFLEENAARRKERSGVGVGAVVVGGRHKGGTKDRAIKSDLDSRETEDPAEGAQRHAR